MKVQADIMQNISYTDKAHFVANHTNLTDKKEAKLIMGGITLDAVEHVKPEVAPVQFLLK